MSLLNVRLSADLIAKAQSLRKQGINISGLVRQSIESAYEQSKRKRKPKDVRAMLEAIYAKYPIPTDAPRRAFDLRDRRAMREYIVGRLRSKKRQ
jgi:post-segregation antitoxin (ccd killing protein)